MKFPQDVPVLTDGVVTLRAHGEEDLDLLYEMTRDPEALRWTSIPFDNTREDSRHFITRIMKVSWEEKNHRGWAIEAIDDDGVAKFAGNIDIRDTPIADVGFALHPWARGRGVMKRALELASNWAFTEGGVEIIHWRAHVGNASSLRAAWAAGFTLNGIHPGFLYQREQVLDVWAGHLKFGDKPCPKSVWRESTPIESRDLRLRPYRMDDVPRIVEARTDERSQLWLAGLPKPYTEASAREHINSNIWGAANGSKVSWVVADRESDLLLASIAIFGMAGLDPLSGEIGYWAHPDARGRGVMTEATRLVIEHAFGPMGMRRLSLMAATGNTASNKVAIDNGFALVGTETRAEPLGDGSFADMNVYELLP